jgi:hypothetical protein
MFFTVVDATVATFTKSRDSRISVVEALTDLNFIPIVLLVYALVVGFSITGLMLFHWYLVVRNLTTAEHLKSAYESEELNPWDLGSWWSNMIAKWTGAVDERTFSCNYQCFVVKEIVKREMQMLTNEREEENRIRKVHHKKNANVEENRQTFSLAEPDPTFAAAATGLYI